MNSTENNVNSTLTVNDYLAGFIGKISENPMDALVQFPIVTLLIFLGFLLISRGFVKNRNAKKVILRIIRFFESTRKSQPCTSM